MLLVDEMSIQTWIFTKNKDQIKYDKKMYVIIFIWSCLLRVTIHIDSISITVSFILSKRFHILFYDISDSNVIMSQCIQVDNVPIGTLSTCRVKL